MVLSFIFPDYTCFIPRIKECPVPDSMGFALTKGGLQMRLEVLTEYFTRYGGVAIFTIVFLEYMNLPGFPAGIIMPLSGIMAAKGNIGFVQVMILSLLAGLLGSLVLYGLGRGGGELFLNKYIRRFPKQKDCIEKNLKWIREKGCIGVFLGKLIPMFRTLISIPAGVVKMPLDKYVLSSACGIFIWNFVFVGAGYVLGDEVFSILGKVGF